jgi:periplasmic protein TonB
MLSAATAPESSTAEILQDPLRFVRVPKANNMTLHFPREAFRNGVPGQVTLDCAVTGEGSLADCRIKAEQPQGRGFGLAAMRLSRKYASAADSNPASSQNAGRIEMTVGFLLCDLVLRG